MTTIPRISVVTSSFNQGKFLGRTIESVKAQNYANLEHIVVDNLSTDETPEVLAAHPHLRVIREADRGQSEAINKGFRLATGDILCFLNSDDTFLPGALHRVAHALDAARGPHVVMGRCLHIDENDRPTGIEHPSAFFNHRRVLEVWKGHWIPQPATFWTREAWRRCGPLDEAEDLVPDFDLMCRLSRHYAFGIIDQPLATYRLHTHSKSCSHTPEQIYAQAIRVSQRYWGSPLWPTYWQLLLSLIGHRLEERLGRKRRASALAIAGQQALAEGRKLRRLACLAASAALAPRLALRRLLRPARSHGGAGSDRWQDHRLSPRTLIYRNFTGLHPDQHAGPVFITNLQRECAVHSSGDRWLHFEGAPVLGWLPLPAYLDVAIDGRPVARYPLRAGCSFSLAVPIADLTPGAHELAVTADAFVVVDDYLGNADDRPLAYWLAGLRREAQPLAA